MGLMCSYHLLEVGVVPAGVVEVDETVHRNVFEQDFALDTKESKGNSNILSWFPQE